LPAARPAAVSRFAVYQIDAVAYRALIVVMKDVSVPLSD
jgi:hypothetical protein